jgi:hypothetical protein
MRKGCGLILRNCECSRPKKRVRHGLWKGGVNLMAGYDISAGEIWLWWSVLKRERPRCGARCRDGMSCEVPPVWDKHLYRPVHGRCRMHGGLSTRPTTEQGRQRIAESNRARSSRRISHEPPEKRGCGEKVTQHGDIP